MLEFTFVKHTRNALKSMFILQMLLSKQVHVHIYSSTLFLPKSSVNYPYIETSTSWRKNENFICRLSSEHLTKGQVAIESTETQHFDQSLNV